MARIPGISETILVAPDSFKGTFSALEVAESLGAGVAAAGLTADLCPVADGGEGTLAALAGPMGAEPRTARATDPLGHEFAARFGLAGETAIVETAAASGLDLIPEADRDPFAASTYGTGELILAAIEAGARIVYIGVGGSATTDGGAGAIRAIRDGVACGRAARRAVRRPHAVRGRRARVRSPEGGRPRRRPPANTAAGRPRAADGARPARRADDGGGGRTVGGLWAAFGAELVAGAPFVLDAAGFDRRMRAARAVVAGEGRLDRQSLAGKLVSEVATRARQSGVPCFAVCGRCELDSFGRRILDLQAVIEAGTRQELERAGRTLATTI